jgi:hypothetical protein
MSQSESDPLYQYFDLLRSRRVSRPDAKHIHFVLDYQAWQRAEPGTDPDKIERFSKPHHLGLGDAHDWTLWDLPLRAMIETLSQRFPEISESRATMPMQDPDFWCEQHEWVNTEYRSAEQQLRRYLNVVNVLGAFDEAAARAFAEQLDPGDAEWVLLTVRETRYWLVHLLQSVTTRLMPPAYLLRTNRDGTPPAAENSQN